MDKNLKTLLFPNITMNVGFLWNSIQLWLTNKVLSTQSWQLGAAPTTSTAEFGWSEMTACISPIMVLWDITWGSFWEKKTLLFIGSTFLQHLPFLYAIQSSLWMQPDFYFGARAANNTRWATEPDADVPTWRAIFKGFLTQSFFTVWHSVANLPYRVFQKQLYPGNRWLHFPIGLCFLLFSTGLLELISIWACPDSMNTALLLKMAA